MLDLRLQIKRCLVLAPLSGPKEISSVVLYVVALLVVDICSGQED